MQMSDVSNIGSMRIHVVNKKHTKTYFPSHVQHNELQLLDQHEDINLSTRTADEHNGNDLLFQPPINSWYTAVFLSLGLFSVFSVKTGSSPSFSFSPSMYTNATLKLLTLATSLARRLISLRTRTEFFFAQYSKVYAARKLRQLYLATFIQKAYSKLRIPGTAPWLYHQYNRPP